MSLIDGESQVTQQEGQGTEGAQQLETGLTAEQKPEWMYSADVPGTGPAPEWFKKNKYVTLEDQAKAYTELEKRFGSFTGAPKDGQYTVNIPEDLKEKGIDFDSDDPLYQEAMEFAKNSHMSQEGFDQMMGLWASAKVAESAAMEEFKTMELKSLGDNAKARIDNLVNWGKANLPDDMFNGFQEMAVSANAIKTMEKLVSMTRNAPIDSDNARPKNGVDEEELRKMQFEKDEHGNRRLSVDPEFRKKFNKLKEQVWGSEEHRMIIGS